MCEAFRDPAGMDDAALNLAITGYARAEAATAGHRLALIAELVDRRLGTELALSRERSACDAWDCCAAEIAADLIVSHRTASGLMYRALDLRDRIPLTGDLLRRGDITLKVAATASWRTQLIVDPDALARVDADLAAVATRWGGYSEQKLADAIDAAIERHDPDAVRRFRTAQRSLNIAFGKPDDATGTRSIYGRVSALDAELTDRRLDAMATSVCPEDPRTHGERRVAALGIINAGGDHLPCLCGSPDCPATGPDARGKQFEILVLTDNPNPAADGRSDGPGPDNGPDDDDDGPRYDRDYDWEQHWTDEAPPEDEEEPELLPGDGEPDRDVDPTRDDGLGDDPDVNWEHHRPGADDEPDDQDLEPPPEDEQAPDPPSEGESCGTPATPAPCGYTAIIAGGSVLPAALLADLCRMGASVRTVAQPEDLSAEVRYRPSIATQRLVRARDMTCRFLGCDHPAEYADLDHTVPYGRPGGLTHPGNIATLCRKHHLLKTFWVGDGGWSELQLDDGTIVWTSPSGLKHRAPPGSRIYFPNWDPTTPLPDTPTPVVTEPPPGRDLRMPQRRRTRAQQRAATIAAERRRNHEDRLAECTAPF
ncbi:HNH endonuclease signature motif containing protein [Mycolicibacterium arenosum]|uniref:HNH endonuclease n=1 Tax=Mycolicibacterium arenosum TaxID=2952157 RepID=A0ABT1M6L2_9MYCO|nr:HNH endonuclease signature motif containing protein [Mycolicibacterium sp. CAU 1645]MCP9274803.1 HNH endonuclease [Mycolicibacterium sp. CAU 1645]